jgi:outer membrane protein assembly factor BamB
MYVSALPSNRHFGGPPMRRSIQLLLVLSLLPACDSISGFFDDAVPLVIATSNGRVARLDATDEEASPVWDAEIPPSSAVTLLVSGGDVYAASGSQLQAFDLETGGTLWTAPADFGVTVVNVVGPLGGALFALTFDDLVAVDAATGVELWRQDLNLTLTDAADEAMVAGGGALVLGGDPIRSLDPATGDVLATFDTPDSDVRALVLSGGAVLAGLADGLVSLDPSSLSLGWRLDAPDQVDNIAGGGGSVLYSVLGGGIAAATDAGAPAGAAEDGEIFQHVAVDGDRFLGVRADGLLVAWDRAAFADCTAAAACASLWEVPGSSATVDALAVGGDAVYQASGGILEAIIGADGGALWDYQTDGDVVAVVVP